MFGLDVQEILVYVAVFAAAIYAGLKTMRQFTGDKSGTAAPCPKCGCGEGVKNRSRRR